MKIQTNNYNVKWHGGIMFHPTINAVDCDSPFATIIDIYGYKRPRVRKKQPVALRNANKNKHIPFYFLYLRMNVFAY